MGKVAWWIFDVRKQRWRQSSRRASVASGLPIVVSGVMQFASELLLLGRFCLKMCNEN